MAKDLLKSLASIEAEIQKLEKLQKTQVADSPVKDKAFLERRALESAKVNRKNLGINQYRHILDHKKPTLSSTLATLKLRQQKLREALGTRTIKPGDQNPIWSEFGIRAGDNPQWNTAFDQDTIKAKLKIQDLEGIQDDFGGKKDKDRLTIQEAAAYQSGEGIETVFEPNVEQVKKDSNTATVYPSATNVIKNKEPTNGKEAVGLEGQLQAQLKAFKPTTIQKQLLKAGFTKGELIKKMNAHEKWKADRRR